ncbi:MAG: lycopene cyclase family protein [Acidobacteriota bacterium]
MTTKPILIAGAGAAGLSLAVHLLEAGCRRELILVEPRERYRDDRTWCYWHFGGHPFDDCVSHRWSRWRLRAAGREAIGRSPGHPYCHIGGGAFYRAALDRISDAPHVRLELGARVLDHRPASGGGVRVETTSGVVEARYLFDSRHRPAEGGLVQHFAGLFVRSGRDVFDPTTPTLMDFDAVRPTETGEPLPGVHFIYVLPFSRREALVESTLFTPRPLFTDLPAVEKSHFDAADAYLRQRYPDMPFEVVRRESGAIPMARSRGGARRGHPVVPIGTAAGCARPSSGYAFEAIQRTSGAFARAVLRGDDPGTVTVWRRRAQWLDRIFLSFLEHRPDLAPSVFVSLFDRLPGDFMPRFLSDRESIGEVLRMMTAMPAGAFAREWLRVSTAAAPQS